MPRTLPQPDPPRLRQISAICSRSTPCVDGSLSKSNISRIERRASTHGVDLPGSVQPSPGTGGGFTASPQSDTAPPNQQKTRAALALALTPALALAVACQRPALPQVQGAALQTRPPLRTKTFSLFSANRHPFATPVPYCAAACARGRPMLKIARPSLRSIQDDIAMAGSWGSSHRKYQATRRVPLPLHGDSDNVTSN